MMSESTRMRRFKKIASTAFVAVFLSATAGCVTVPGTSSGGAVDVDGLVGQGNGIVERYQSALTNLLQAQELLSVALGIKNAVIVPLRRPSFWPVATPIKRPSKRQRLLPKKITS